jgi:hypothetical protein
MLKNVLKEYTKRDRDGNLESSQSNKVIRSETAQTRLPNNVATIVFQCREGSVTHFYHFFFAALLPLIEYHLEYPDKIFIISTDIGPMKKILCEMPFNIIEFHGPDLSKINYFHDDKSLQRQRRSGDVCLKAYDSFNSIFYHSVLQLSHTTRNNILSFFERTCPPYILLIPTYDIILIQRSVDSYYKSGCQDRAVIYQTSGTDRRSIENHHELEHALQSKYGNSFCNIILERSSIYYQYHMFRNAKVVIAQHGAALANIFFMRNGEGGVALPNSECKSNASVSTVIEITPPWSREFEHFKNLADYCRINHIAINQDTDHGAVDISAIVNAVDSSIP